jgi:RimJ/RimL family protein N-acetyltransferase
MRPIELPAGGLDDGGLALRFPRLEDVPAYHAAYNDPAIVKLGGLPLDRPDLRTVCRLLAERVDERRTGRGAVVVLDESGSFVGGGGLRNLRWEEGIGDVAYWLRPDARGRGLATRAARLLASWAFDLGLQRVQALTAPENVASQRVLERAGFTREGVVRSQPWRDGRRDQVMFSLLRGE